MNLGRLLVSFVSVATVVGAPLADWNGTHVFNPKWPPHAKFHNGQSMSLGALLGFTALWLAWRKKGNQGLQLNISIWLAALYWLAQATGALYPGAAFADPEFRSRPIQHLPGTRIPAQLGLEAVLLSMLAAAWRLAIRRRRD
jgi:hypothetical protein